jgi:hypothetical protein
LTSVTCTSMPEAGPSCRARTEGWRGTTRPYPPWPTSWTA